MLLFYNFYSRFFLTWSFQEGAMRRSPWPEACSWPSTALPASSPQNLLQGQFTTLITISHDTESAHVQPVPWKAFKSADCCTIYYVHYILCTLYTMYTIYYVHNLSLCSRSADPNAFRGTACIWFVRPLNLFYIFVLSRIFFQILIFIGHTWRS